MLLFDQRFTPDLIPAYTWLMTLPNNLFEFIVAELAVIPDPSPAMADIVQQYRVGWVAPGFGCCPQPTDQRIKFTQPVQKSARPLKYSMRKPN
jgi:hypothetical protein